MKESNRWIGIMVAARSRRKPMLRRCLAGKPKDAELFSFTPKGIDWFGKTIRGICFRNGKWVRERFPFPAVVVNRCYEPDRAVLERLACAIGPGRVFNAVNRFDKLDVYRLLTRWLKPHLPDTLPYDREAAAFFLEKHKIVYFKPRTGRKGEGVYRMERKDPGEIHLGHHHFSPASISQGTDAALDLLDGLIGSVPYLMQQGVDVRQLEGHSFDIRALVQKNRKGRWSVTNVISRSAHPGCYNTSLCEKVSFAEEVLGSLYPPERVRSILQDVYNAGMRSAEILELDAGIHLGEIGVDFGLDPNGHVWIIEVNGMPQKDLYEDVGQRSKVDLKPIQYARYLLNRRKTPEGSR